MTPELLEAIRALLLPVEPDREEDVLDTFEESLGLQGVADDDRAAWLRGKHERWQETGAPDAEFQAVVVGALGAASAEFGEALAAQYFVLHRHLCDRHSLSHSEASAFLSHLLLILMLATHARMSAAQITKLLAVRDARLTFRWRTVQDALSDFELKPRLHSARAQRVVASDRQSEAVFGDADVAVAADIVGDFASQLGFAGDMRSLLLQLVPVEGQPFAPYLQILHYQCLIAEFYDHAVLNAYEFSPRGQLVTWLCEQYPEALVGAGEPISKQCEGCAAVGSRMGRRQGGHAD